MLVLFVYRGGVPALVFGKKTEDVPHHKGQFSFPGGVVQPSDGSVVEAALREAQEEIGLEAERRRGPGPLRRHAHDRHELRDHARPGAGPRRADLPPGRPRDRARDRDPARASPPAGRVSRGAVGARGRPAARRLRELRRRRGLGHHGAHPLASSSTRSSRRRRRPGGADELRDAARRGPGRRGHPHAQSAGGAKRAQPDDDPGARRRAGRLEGDAGGAGRRHPGRGRAGLLRRRRSQGHVPDGVHPRRAGAVRGAGRRFSRRSRGCGHR